MKLRRAKRKLRISSKGLSAESKTKVSAITVLRSPIRSQFALRLIGTLPQGGIAGNDLILARAYGPTISKLGGVPYGASGSPVYQGRRLLGAVSSVFAPDNYLVGITPIKAMLALAEEPILPTSFSYATGNHDKKLPITTNGIASSKALAALEKHYGKTQYITNQAITTDQAGVTEIKNGDSIGAALMTGDIQLGYIGTATLVQGKELFAFGHPLLFAGATNIPLTTAPIITTTRGDYPQKIGSLGHTIGTIIQDRSAGILALLGNTPKLVHMKFTIQDTDRQQTTTVITQAASINSELPFLTFIATLESMQRAMNRVGPGTATWQWQVTYENKTEPVQFVASQYDSYDIGFVVAASGESLVSQALAEGLSLSSVELTATVTIQQLVPQET